MDQLLQNRIALGNLRVISMRAANLNLCLQEPTNKKIQIRLQAIKTLKVCVYICS